VLILAMAVAGIRVAWVFYERHQEAVQPKKRESPLNPDYYVASKKLYPYDLHSVKQLTKQPVWVKVGYAYPFYAYDAGSHRADLSHEAGKLSPLQKLDIKDVVTGASSPKDPSERQVLAIFEQSGRVYAAPIGTANRGDYKFYSDDMFFIEDPHQLYKHWPADIWQSIAQHQVKPGMSELQADFAIGIGLLQSGSDSMDRTLDYPNGGKPVTISFHQGKAVEIRPGPGS